MSEITYEQIAGAIVELPLASQRELLDLLLAQPGVRDELTNGSAATSLLVTDQPPPGLRQAGEQFEKQWIAALRRVPDDASRAEDWLEAQAWSDL